MFFFFFQAEDGIRDIGVTGVQTCALPIFATTTQVVDRTGYTLQNRTYGLSATQTLNELIADVTYFQAGHNQHVGLAGNITSGGFLRSYGGYEGRVGLKLAVEFQLGIHLMGQASGLNHLVDQLM